jgi:transglutaminase-like putative cysteine protease
MKTATLDIRHETIYRYEKPVGYSIQQLRLTPRTEPLQRIHQWHIMTPGKQQSSQDAFGNQSDILTITTSHQEVRIIANGVVEIQSPHRGRLPEKMRLSPLAFTVPTRLTEPQDAIRAFAADKLPERPHSHQLLDFAASICAAVSYEAGATGASSTASEALALGKGVCQDHAHLFIACCHHAGIPARYVSGYIDPGEVLHSASHAWVDVWVDELDFSGWVSIDVTHARFQHAGYCRLAVGRDYESAAPVRGMRRGGGEEQLDVQVDISQR